jgi:hypothetical protein
LRFRLNLKPILTREGLDRFENNIGEVPREELGLSQSEIASNEKHHDNNTNDVKNIAHVSFSFLSRDRITVEPDARNITETEAGERCHACLTVR